MFQDLIELHNRPRNKFGVTTLFTEHSENTEK